MTVRIETVRRGLAIAATSLFATISHAGSWDAATECYSSGDYQCAFDEGIELLREGRVVVGSDHRTTDSMMFVQMAYVEAAARVTERALGDMAGLVVRELPARSPRLPYLWGFSLLSLKNLCDGEECIKSFDDVFCKASVEFPPVSWRPLKGIDPLTPVGFEYFQRVEALAANCAGES